MPVLNDSTDAVSGLQVHAYPWASWNDSVKKIVISDGITGVGSKSFIAWKNVTEVELGKDVKTIGAGALAQLSATATRIWKQLTAFFIARARKSCITIRVQSRMLPT